MGKLKVKEQSKWLTVTDMSENLKMIKSMVLAYGIIAQIKQNVKLSMLMIKEFSGWQALNLVMYPALVTKQAPIELNQESVKQKDAELIISRDLLQLVLKVKWLGMLPLELMVPEFILWTIHL